MHVVLQNYLKKKINTNTRYTKNKMLESKLANSAKKLCLWHHNSGTNRSIVLFLFNSTRGGHTPGTYVASFFESEKKGQVWKSWSWKSLNRGGGGWGGGVLLISLSDFHFKFYMLQKNIFYICKFVKTVCCEKKLPPPPLPLCYALSMVNKSNLDLPRAGVYGKMWFASTC